jgi:hypothetical protein
MLPLPNAPNLKSRRCGETQFKAAGMVPEKIAEMPRVQARGVEHGKFLNSRPGAAGAWEAPPDDVGAAYEG